MDVLFLFSFLRCSIPFIPQELQPEQLLQILLQELLVTHSAGTARQFCKRGIYIKNGKLVFDGTIDEAVAKYEDSLKKKKGGKK